MKTIKKINHVVALGMIAATLMFTVSCKKTKSTVLATLATSAVSVITTTTASSGGNVTSDGGSTVTARGVCWGTSANPTISNSKTTDGTGTGTFTSSLTGLTAATIYYVRAYATNSVGTAYGTQVSFTSAAISTVLATLATSAVSAITTTTASSGGNVTSDGGSTVTARGVCWSTSSNPTTSDSKTSDGTGSGSFTSLITGLTANTIYNVRAYATNSAGTAYGNTISFTTSLPVQQAVVNLGVAGDFVILSKSGITDVPPSVITGDIGTSPITGAAITGLTCPEVTGIIYTVDDAGPACKVIDATKLTTAVLNMQTAYTDAAGRINPDFLNLGAGIIGGLTLTRGLYKWTSTVSMPTDVTISGGPNDVWIFQVAGTLTMASAVKITLSGGAQAKNIYWAIAGAVTLGTTSHFEGIILAATNIAMQTGATMNGKLLAQTAVTLDKNTVTKP